MTGLYVPQQIADQEFAELLTPSVQPPETSQTALLSDEQPQGDGAFWLGSLQHPRYRLRQTVRLELTAEGDEVIVTWPAANNLFGYGASLPEAIRDFTASLVDLYESMGDGELAPSVEQLRTLLLAHIGSQTR